MFPPKDGGKVVGASTISRRVVAVGDSICAAVSRRVTNQQQKNKYSLEYSFLSLEHKNKLLFSKPDRAKQPRGLLVTWR